MSQVTRFDFDWFWFAAVFVSLCVVPPVGVNENVRLKAVGTNTDVPPITCAGVYVPLPFTDTITGCVPHIAVTVRLFSAFVGSAAAVCASTATARATTATRTPRL